MRKKITVQQKILKRIDLLEKTYRNVMSQLTEMERKMVVKPQRYLKFDECIPPTNVCKEIVSMTRGLTSYGGFLGKLAEYYGCSSMEFLVSQTMCKPEYNAIYYPNMKRAYTYRDYVSKETVLHEWFHHMINEKVVYLGEDIKIEQEEEFAKKYSRIFMERVNS